jgi:shikimate kinase
MDSDDEIERDSGLTIARIFATKGEVWFRRTEERTVRQIVEREPAGVLALGGGALENARTRDLLHRVGQLVWLRATPEELWDRVTGSSRPLATDRNRFLRRYARREAFYAGTAQFTADAAQPVDVVVAEIQTWLEGAVDAGPGGD